jgi:hypothetical protein
MKERRLRSAVVVGALLSGLLILGLACNLIRLSATDSPGPTATKASKPTARPTVTPLVQSTAQLLVGESLLSTPPLAQGIAGWQLWLQGGSTVAGTNEVQWVDDPAYGKVVEFSRTAGGNDGGAAGIYQSLGNRDVSDYPHLYARVVGKVLNEQGGNLSNANPAWFPEGAVQVRVKYLTSNEKEQEWYHGFYAAPVPGADAEHFTRVPRGAWFTYVSPDLTTLPERPRYIAELRVYGFGWEFRGQVAEADLVGSYVGEP